MIVARRKRKWIKGAFRRHKRGALHRQLGIPANRRIPLSVLRRAARSRKLLLRRRAQLALTLRRMRHSKKRRK